MYLHVSCQCLFENFASELKHRSLSLLRTVKKVSSMSKVKPGAVNLATPSWCGFEKKGSRGCTSRRIWQSAEELLRDCASGWGSAAIRENSSAIDAQGPKANGVSGDAVVADAANVALNRARPLALGVKVPIHAD